MVLKLTTDTFEKETKESAIPVLVDCYADWCGPCKMMAPVVDALAEKYDGKIKVCNINVDEDGDALRAFHVMSIPTFLIFKDGELVKTMIGAKAPADFEAELLAAAGL